MMKDKVAFITGTSQKKLPKNGHQPQPQEVADAVLWLCSPQSSFVIGQALAVDGGYTIL